MSEAAALEVFRALCLSLSCSCWCCQFSRAEEDEDDPAPVAAPMLVADGALAVLPIETDLAPKLEGMGPR